MLFSRQRPSKPALKAKLGASSDYFFTARPQYIHIWIFTTLTFIIAVCTACFKVNANELGAKFSFEEHSVEFRNQDVNIVGSLLLPKIEAPVPAVVIVHGAGRQNRGPYREVGEYFATQGIAALIYDKRGTGASSGEYESYEPYENLVNDALSAVDLLKKRREIAPSQIGIWGLSQGAYISAVAASRSEDIKFIIVVGADVADGMMFYYRDNLFRRFGLSETLRDVAEKTYLVQQDLGRTIQEGFRLTSFLSRSYPPPDEYVHPAWSHVSQPVLAFWGALDQHVPVGESVAGLKNSLALANNDKWTMIILPETNHDLKISGSSVAHSKSQGYPPGTLQNMADWAKSTINCPLEISRRKLKGTAPRAEILPRLARYESLRWYGNGTVQASLWILFLIGFVANAVAAVRYALPRLLCRQQRLLLLAPEKVANLHRAISMLNFLIFIAFSITAILTLDQLHPRCPSVLLFLPTFGTVSLLATTALLLLIAWTPRDRNQTAPRTMRFSLEVLISVLFIPYLLYWNLVGFRF